MTINEMIKTLLKEKSKTQTELADYIGVSQNTVSDWINKGKNPSANYTYRISDFSELALNIYIPEKIIQISLKMD